MRGADVTGPSGGSRAGRKLGQGEVAGAPKVTLLEKWMWMRTVVADPSVPREVLATAFVVADLVNDKLGYAFAGQDHIATAVGVSKTSIVSHLKTLVVAGHLGVTRQGTKPSHYRLLYKPQMPSGGPDGKEFKPSGTHGNLFEPQEFKSTGTHSGQKGGQEFKFGPALSSSRLETTKPNTKRSEKPASPEPHDCEGRQAGQADDVGRSASPSRHNPQVEHGPERQAIDARWIEAAGPDLARSLSTDDEGTNRLHRAIVAGDFTAEDVETGIADFRRKHPGRPRRYWGFFETWAAKAAKARPPAEATTAAIPADVGPTVAVPNHETTRWPADSVTRWAARWWSGRRSWADCLGDTPDKVDPRRSAEFQAALDAGRAEIEAAARAWPGNRTTWDVERLGPRLDDLASRLGPDFGVEVVALRHGWGTFTVSALDLHLRRLASDFADEWEHEIVGTFRALPSPSDNNDSALPPEWQIKALEYRSAKS